LALRVRSRQRSISVAFGAKRTRRISALLPTVQAGKSTLMMVTNQQRSPQAPDAPTARGAGFLQLTFPGFVVLFATRSMPADVRERIAADFLEVSKDP
jgi:tripartite-type tricarboxylate transporter receptor subunit TctC